MKSNKPKCIDLMEKLHKSLTASSYTNIITLSRDTILCKYIPTGIKQISNNITTVVNGDPNKSCSYITSHTCPYTACTYPNEVCPHQHLHNNGSVNGGNTNTEVFETITTDYTLFRISPTDIYSGIFLNVIKLHGEKCDLKLTFDDPETCISEIIKIIKFLTK